MHVLSLGLNRIGKQKIKIVIYTPDSFNLLLVIKCEIPFTAGGSSSSLLENNFLGGNDFRLSGKVSSSPLVTSDVTSAFLIFIEAIL